MSNSESGRRADGYVRADRCIRIENMDGRDLTQWQAS